MLLGTVNKHFVLLHMKKIDENKNASFCLYEKSQMLMRMVPRGLHSAWQHTNGGWRIPR